MAEEKPTVEPTSLEALERVETTNVRPACFKSTIQEALFVLTCTMAIAMSAWLAGAVTVISSFVGADLNMTTAEITWITSATSLASGAFLLFFGKLADLFGRKSMFVGSLLLYAVFALGAGFSKDPLTLDVLSGFLGLVSASAVPPAIGLLGIIYDQPSKRKNAAFACFSAGNPLGFVFGTIFSGIATQIFNWRASYYLIAIIFLLFSIIGCFTIPQDPSVKEKFTWQTVKRFDIVGTILTIAGIGMFSAALSLGDTAEQGWKTAYVLALLIIGIVLLIGFVVWEIFYAYPLMPMSIWKDKNFSLCMAILALGFFAFTPGQFFVALFFQNVWHMSALQVAVHLLPMVIMGILTNIFAGIFMHRISNKLLMLAGTMGYTIAYLLAALNRVDSSYWAFFFPSFLFVVIGADLEFTVANLYVVQSFPKESQSIAGGIFQTIVRLCMTVGFGITTALFNATQQNPGLASYWSKEIQPYTITFWFSFACAALSVCLVPFLTIGTQGGKEKRAVESPRSERSGSLELSSAEKVET
ncbi:hypothetical protein AMS68_006898 [Peltaster fructicola]|uniref:Major facilitator superfamily (MFS) profile domain-containing protein n=1 Tax=Peltaster fructicola TaxID=286661 RepID=A0A6H0Y392_9PEZI|nr:hypothetical protein AMS68_006898 [Peltaster fructicola]